MLKNIKKNNKGFTIIEVLIVLAIAGLILLVVFLAVPALQRNSRNTQRKNDVSALLGAVQEYSNNNSGAMPTLASDITSLAKTGYYKTADVSLTATVTTAALTTDVVKVTTGAKCSTTGTITATGASARQIAVQYMVDGSGGLVAACQDS